LTFEEKALRKIFVPKIKEAQEDKEKYIVRSLKVCTLHLIILCG
jgi:hypothetical protein